jgi:hypothetical protein
LVRFLPLVVRATREGATVQLERGRVGRAVLSGAFQREARLVRDLKEALPVEARTIFFRQLDDLLGLLAEPKCAECQADGVPCPHVGVSCELCGRATQWVHDLREAIARSST